MLKRFRYMKEKRKKFAYESEDLTPSRDET